MASSDRRTEFERSALLLGLLALGGLTLWLLYRVAPPLPESHRVGKAEAELRFEASKVLPSRDASYCAYYAKHLVLSCPIPSVDKAMISHDFAKEGWQGPGGEEAFRHGRLRADFECNRAAPDACSVRLVYMVRD